MPKLKIEKGDGSRVEFDTLDTSQTLAHDARMISWESRVKKQGTSGAVHVPAFVYRAMGCDPHDLLGAAFTARADVRHRTIKIIFKKGSKP